MPEEECCLQPGRRTVAYGRQMSATRRTAMSAFLGRTETSSSFSVNGSIAAALHAAFASPATRYLDLDGSLDLARDVVSGGFTLEDGVMRTTAAPGLGVSPASP
jgi:L-alanine-DL-glutamate epimerase-like enolase superfamily enzyme